MRQKERKSYECFIGKKFGKLLIIDLAPPQKKGIGVLFLCQCDCGKNSTPRASSVISGKTKTCNCSWNESRGTPCVLERHLGEKFSKLTISQIVRHNKQRVCLCICECGKTTKTRYNNLKNGSASSCGCSKIPTLEKKKDMFLRFVKKEEKCWIWSGNISTWDNRYGTYHGKRAHRVAYELFLGPIPKGMHILHQCDRPLCVSPNCLFLGNAKLNSDDMVSKDRHARGERSGMAKYNNEIVLEIRKQFSEGYSQTELSELHEIPFCSINNIVNRRRWKHV